MHVLHKLPLFLIVKHEFVIVFVRFGEEKSKVDKMWKIMWLRSEKKCEVGIIPRLVV